MEDERFRGVNNCDNFRDAEIQSDNVTQVYVGDDKAPPGNVSLCIAVPQVKNHEQRKYSDDYLNSLYEN